MKTDLRGEKEEIVREYGRWTLHNIKLSDEVWTIGQENDPDVNPFAVALNTILQVSSDLCGGDLSGVSVADLGCGEGGYAVEFALQGANVTAVEGREASYRKAMLAKEALDLNSLNVVLDDVRNLGRKKYGPFDIVLCIGLLYHLDGPELCDFVSAIHSVCNRFAVFDTQLADFPKVSLKCGDKVYWGERFPEDPANGRDVLWSSIGNPMSFWFTKASLMNLLCDVGFTSAYEVKIPYSRPPVNYPNRSTIVAVKGKPVSLRAVPGKPKRVISPEHDI